MPELPEVETVKRGLEKLIIGKLVTDVDYDWPKSFPNNKETVRQFLIGAEFTEIKRRAKVLLMKLSSNYTLVTHLKMTGQLVFDQRKAGVGRQESVKQSASSIQSLPTGRQAPENRFAGGHPTDSLINRLPDKSTRVIIKFEDKSVLYFNDQRKFGWMRLIATPEVNNIDFLKKIGPEPHDVIKNPQIEADIIKRIRSSTRAIKAVLLDQTVIAGIGNIYADEALFAAKIHPATKADTLTKARISKLLKAALYVIDLSITKGGSTDKNYVDAEGKKGNYLKFAKAFRREGQPCPRCSATIIKTKVAGRGTHLCPSCQK